MARIRIDKVYGKYDERLARLACMLMGKPDAGSGMGTYVMMKFIADNGVFYTGHFGKGSVPKEGSVLECSEPRNGYDIEDANGNRYSVILHEL